MIKPGTLITYVGADGETRTECIHSIGYRSATPEIRKQLNRWQRLIRCLTPPRWRHPIPVVREYQPAKVVLGFHDDPEAVKRTLRNVQQINDGVARILKVHGDGDR